MRGLCAERSVGNFVEDSFRSLIMGVLRKSYGFFKLILVVVVVDTRSFKLIMM